MTLTLSRPDLLRHESFLNNEWVRSGRTFAVTNPATGEVLADVPDCGEEEARAAVDCAQRAYQAWRRVVARDRAALLRRWHQRILDNQEDLARLISLEQGKPLAESRGEVAYGASYVEWFAEEAKRAYGDVIPQQHNGRRLLTVREPVGVVAAITPWNFPMAMIARKIAPAIAAGCAVVAKPAEDTPLTSLALVKLLQEAGAPAGLVNMLTTSRARASVLADVWLADSRVRKISFTGSTAVGKHLARESAPTLKKLSLELGGNAPFIVFDDADLHAAVDGLMVAKFRNAGQTCICPNRVYVQRGIHDAFVAALSERVRQLKVGPASNAASQIGPLINLRALEKVQEHVADAVLQGASIAVGGKVFESQEAPGGHFYAPTVLTGVTAAMRMSCEETFGPVVPVTAFDGEQEAVALANDTPYGLAAYVYTRDIGRAWELGEAIEAGMVAVNDGVLSTEIAPFGGIKESGYGREGSRYGLEEYMHIKYLCHGNLDRPRG
ncbi:succinate semialdehyde dehydrogenase [Noviherbaspirillum humi]|uniref:Succinate semialdehyde dehydrogenase n=1 Tax=Noviherbaspirillum humi TaxID=1688639 RepID=A0A239EZ49_9BURK|nr:NAD-dependent succinate-semialdehyde dehydrogenase [Noviherbaspirillum humi]SNS49558.1 succinate semialdehyde dehydrogenase [Noviherbaspirillum humi]